MLKVLRQRSSRLWFAAVFAMAMATLGFAHRPLPGVGGPAAMELALPGGLAQIFCGPMGDIPHQAATHCDACMLQAAPGLLAEAPALPDLPEPSRRRLPVLADADIAAQHLTQPRPRGPPSV